jgi:hypothetical protein
MRRRGNRFGWRARRDRNPDAGLGCFDSVLLVWPKDSLSCATHGEVAVQRFRGRGESVRRSTKVRGHQLWLRTLV